MTTQPVITLQSVTKRFDGVTAVDGVSLALHEGEFFALLGPSGCGKTTLLRMIAGFEDPDDGVILLDGHDIASIGPHQRPVNLMFQSYALFPHMDVQRNVSYGLEMEKLPRRQIRQRVNDILEQTQLTDLARRKPAQLSGGQRQRVALARALIKRPRVLLLDEPLGALDKKLRQQMQLELKRLQHEFGITFVIVTHDQEEALVMADRIALMNQGRVEQLDTPRNLYAEPATRFAAEFIGDTNLFEGQATATGVYVAGLGELDANHQLEVGTACALSVRPERLLLSTTPPETQTLQGTISDIAYHGQDEQVVVNIDGYDTPITVRVNADTADGAHYRIGTHVWCHWPRAHSRVVTHSANDQSQTNTLTNQYPSISTLSEDTMSQKIIAFFPEAAFGPALNSVGIAQAVEKEGHKAVFLSDPGFVEVYENYGFECHPVNLSEPMPAEAMAKFWEDFINGHIPNFAKSPIDQIDNYVKDCWEAIVDSAKWAEKDLPQVLAKVKPDVMCVDNVILFPAIKRYASENNKPWVRIISCSENEIEEEGIPPHLSGCGENDSACHQQYRARFSEVIKPIHDDFNAFLAECGEAAYPLGEFFEPSPHMNLLLYPEAVKFNRQHPLDPKQFQYLDGCVRTDEPYEIPTFKAHKDKPLIYVSYGSLGAGDTDLLKRVIATIANMEIRALVNVGDYLDAYTDIPDNVHLASWYPQPSVIPQVDGVIHHGGNNSFTECLYFGKPAIIMPYVWDGHDNATRVQETGHGYQLDRYQWTETELADKILSMLSDQAMLTKLAATAKASQSQHGPTKAAQILSQLAQ